MGEGDDTKHAFIPPEKNLSRGPGIFHPDQIRINTSRGPRGSESKPPFVGPAPCESSRKTLKNTAERLKNAIEKLKQAAERLKNAAKRVEKVMKRLKNEIKRLKNAAKGLKNVTKRLKDAAKRLKKMNLLTVFEPLFAEHRPHKPCSFRSLCPTVSTIG